MTMPPSSLIIADIQRNYYLHPDDITYRKENPTTSETRRQLEGIQRLERTLDILSAELYSDRTHFILELIQNADDNEYDMDVIPTLRIRLSRGLITVESNETGFEERHVRALCDINHSTKTDRKVTDNDSIGEKGIGFKSVFSVADRVCLFSNGFNLELNKNGPLGMLCPKLIDKPDFETAGRTFFELHLNIDDQQYQEVKEMLVGLNAEMLLFTHRLKELEIWCQDDIDGDINMNDSVKYHVFNPNSISPFVVLENSILGDTLYFIYHHRVETMPANPKRGETTEIVLAFPYDSVLREPIIKPQNMFAFLPLHVTAFPFLLHGDFVTQTSREGILESEQWNIRLRDVVPDAFVAAITAMLNHKNTSVNCLEFLSFVETVPIFDFLAPIGDVLFQRLQQEKIVFNLGFQRLLFPAKALLLPSEYTWDGAPLITKDELDTAGYRTYDYADSSYNDFRRKSILQKLGCRQIEMNDLFTVLSGTSVPFRNRPYTWVKQIFKLFQQHALANNGFLTQKSEIQCLKLSDGEWVSLAGNQSIYFPSDINIDTALGSLEFNILDPEFHQQISSSPEFQYLFRTVFGIKDLSSRDVVDAIIEYHSGAKASDLTLEMTLAHIIFLQDQHIPSEVSQRIRSKFHLIDQNGVPTVNTVLCQDRRFVSDTGTTVLLSEICNEKLALLSPKYNSAAYSDFIDNFLAIKTYPPLLVPNSRIPTNFYTNALSAERQDSNVILAFLADIYPGESHPHESWKTFLYEIAVMKVFCENGKLAPISSCYLRTSALAPFLTDDLNVIKLHEPTDLKWNFLRDLRVRVTPTLDLHIHKIRQLKLHGSLPLDLNSIYKPLVAFLLSKPQSGMALGRLSDLFEDEKLLLVPLTSQQRWLSPKEVYNDCPPWVIHTISLPSTDSVYYSQLLKWLQFPYWRPNRDFQPEITQTARKLSTEQKWEDLANYLFNALNSLMEYLSSQSDSHRCPPWIQHFLRQKNFVIKQSNGEYRLGSLNARVFVADSSLLNPIFESKVDFLYFGDHDIVALLELLRSSDLKLRYLSSYDRPEDMNIKVIPPLSDDHETHNLLQTAKLTLFRLLLDRGPFRKWGVSKTSEKWNSLKIQFCDALEQIIRIPEFRINEHYHRQTHFVKTVETATIYVLRETPLSMRLVHLSEALGRYFEVPEMAARMGLILAASNENRDEMLQLWRVPSLPREWEGITVAPGLSQEMGMDGEDVAAAEVNSTEDLTPREAEFLMRQSAATAEIYLDRDTISEIPESIHLIPRPGDPSDIETHDRGLRSGFAGEYFLYSLLKQKLPSFTEINWTSHLRKYAGFSQIQEGLSDFLIQGDDIPVFLKLFEIPEERKWTAVYIEVKASATRKGNSKFRISSNQFKLVSPV